MRKEVKDLLARLNLIKPEINLTRLLLVVLPMMLVLIASLVSLNLTNNNVVAATEKKADYVGVYAVDNTVIEVVYLVRAALGNTVVVDLVRLAAVDDVEAVLIRDAARNADVYLVR